MQFFLDLNSIYLPVLLLQVGHMRTNKACPKFVGDETTGSINVALTAEDEELMEKRLEEENLLSSGQTCEDGCWGRGGYPYLGQFQIGLLSKLVQYLQRDMSPQKNLEKKKISC